MTHIAFEGKNQNRPNDFWFLGKAAKIGHGPATVIGCVVKQGSEFAKRGFRRPTESQETYPTSRS
jgi:hypothetical protein